jgi:hypothetical protein
VFKSEEDKEHETIEPWPLKATREYAKDLIGAKSTGAAEIQNLRAVLFNWIMQHRVEESEFKSFYNLLKICWKFGKIPLKVKNVLKSKTEDPTPEALDQLTEELYKSVVVNEFPLITNCEKMMGSDAYLARYSKLCSEYIKGIKVMNLIEGNTYPDLDKSIDKLSQLFKDFLLKEVRRIETEAARKRYMENTKMINAKLKNITNVTIQNTQRFCKTLEARYELKLKQAAKMDEAKYQKRLKFLKENLDVVGYNLWEYMTKQWMVRELLMYFDQHPDELVWFSEGYLSTEMIILRSRKLSEYMKKKIYVGKKKIVGVKTLAPIDATTDPGVYDGQA